jgi:hypothetical protein
MHFVFKYSFKASSPNLENYNLICKFKNEINNAKKTTIPKSLPNPDFLKPPNGAATSVLL